MLSMRKCLICPPRRAQRPRATCGGGPYRPPDTGSLCRRFTSALVWCASRVVVGGLKAFFVWGRPRWVAGGRAPASRGRGRSAPLRGALRALFFGALRAVGCYQAAARPTARKRPKTGLFSRRPPDRPKSAQILTFAAPVRPHFGPVSGPVRPLKHGKNPPLHCAGLIQRPELCPRSFSVPSW